jgi:hypothetical protein
MMRRYLFAPALLLVVCAARAAPVDSQCAQRFLSMLTDPAKAREASGLFDAPGAATSSSASTARALVTMTRELAGISHIEPLASMPDGKTARVEIGAPPVDATFIGHAFSAESGADGKVYFFVSQRPGYSCSISALALHIPAARPHFEERARAIARAVATNPAVSRGSD